MKSSHSCSENGRERTNTGWSKTFGHFTRTASPVRFQYEWHDEAGNWFRSYGNEQWGVCAERADAAA